MISLVIFPYHFRDKTFCYSSRERVMACRLHFFFVRLYRTFAVSLKWNLLKCKYSIQVESNRANRFAVLSVHFLSNAIIRTLRAIKWNWLPMVTFVFFFFLFKITNKKLISLYSDTPVFYVNRLCRCFD